MYASASKGVALKGHACVYRGGGSKMLKAFAHILCE